MATVSTRSYKSRRQMNMGRIAGQFTMHFILIVVALACIMPFVWMFFASFKSYQEIVSSQALLPKVWTIATYKQILGRVGFPRAFLNSSLIAIPTVISVVLTSTAVGYGFAKYTFWFKETLFTLILATMMVPFTVVCVPLFITLNDMGLYNKLAGIIVTGLFSAFGIFMLRQFIETIPNDYVDAARIDGASEPWIFRQVIIPLTTAPMSALAVLTFLGSWDNFLWPSIVLRSPTNKTLPLIMASFQNLFIWRFDIYASGAMLTVIPVMLLFTIAQRQFVQGLAMTGLKG